MMSVPATLANQLYQHLGETPATVLTEWLHIMDTTMHDKFERMNEANYARFSAEMHAKFAELRLELRTEIARVESRLAWQMVATMATLFGVLIALGEKFLRS